jgi:hypothetical protein
MVGQFRQKRSLKQQIHLQVGRSLRPYSMSVRRSDGGVRFGQEGIGCAPSGTRPIRPSRTSLRSDVGPAYSCCALGAFKLRACHELSRGRRWEPSFLSSRREERRIWSIFERRRNEENWPQPSGSRRKSRHTSLSSSTVVPPQPSDSASSPPHGRRPVRGGLVWRDFRPRPGVPGVRTLRAGVERRPRESSKQALG